MPVGTGPPGPEAEAEKGQVGLNPRVTTMSKLTVCAADCSLQISKHGWDRGGSNTNLPDPGDQLFTD